MGTRLGRSLIRLIGLAFVMAGSWVFLVNLAVFGYQTWVWAYVLASGAVGAGGGLLYLLSVDGPPRHRMKRTRILGWLGMLVLALMPSSLWIVLLPLILLAVPTLFVRPAQVEVVLPDSRLRLGGLSI